ncbi:hypothetical protein K2173_001913 [Erythroxylum novogranatense]|uniref:Glycosyltransferase n=1 Tax=Erythroxylum novogranatense TaxID=1862640 RepID=A0AAV8SP43_9ROSI|nr:hypothetical protein K2173_001913 [Erythroxylum novogranatense]
MVVQSKILHFVLFPFMAQGHMIPMTDIAKLLAHHGVIVTVVTSPANAERFAATLGRAMESGLKIRVIELEFPCEGGLPEGCENIDMLPSLSLGKEFFGAANLFQEPAERLFEELKPKPNCIISDMCLPYTSYIAKKFDVPRITFNGFSCFSILCIDLIYSSRVLERVNSETEYFVVPDLPDRIELTKNQLPEAMHDDLKEFGNQVIVAETLSYGMVINSFEELEQEYVNMYKKFRADKAWCVGPVSLCNKNNMDMLQRGNKSSINGHDCLKWLDSQQPESVIYVCLGSLCNLIPAQMIELGIGLEISKRPFLWALRAGDQQKEVEQWMVVSGFEERIKGRGFISRGWVPQVAILSHTAIAGFLTHCGWNSTLESITAGIPMITWPLFADQFLNEKLVVKVLRTGLSVGASYTLTWGKEEKIGVLVTQENVKNAIEMLMNGEEKEERRKRVKELSKLAMEAMEEDGSSHRNISLLIKDIAEQVR